jgi:hypothetical protein
MQTVSISNECVSRAPLVNVCTDENTPVPVSDLTIAATHVTSSEGRPFAQEKAPADPHEIRKSPIH